MAKTVMTGREVPHIFATQSQDAGRNANGSLYFRGDTLFSYRDSAPLAKFYGDVVLWNDDSYSVTTSKHQAWARQALRHCTLISVPKLAEVLKILASVERAKSTDKEYGARYMAIAEKSALEYIESQDAAIAENEARIKKMRADWKVNEARGSISMREQACFFVWNTILGKKSDWRKKAGAELAKMRKAERVARYSRALVDLGAHVANFVAPVVDDDASPRQALWQMERDLRGLGYADSLGANRGDGIGASVTWQDAKTLMGVKWAQEYRAEVAKLESLYAPIQARIAELRAEVDALDSVENAEKLEVWLSGQSPNAPRLNRIYCRVIGDEVQTSAGARVPLEDALRVVELAKRCRANGESMARDTIATGSYKGIRISATGDVRIGCHDLPWASIAECVARFRPELAV